MDRGEEDRWENTKKKSRRRQCGKGVCERLVRVKSKSG